MPAALATVTSTVPAAAAAVVAVIDVSELTVNDDAAVAPKLTADALVKSLPVMVTTVPPAVVPAFGLMAATTGTPKVNRSAAEVALVPAALATVTCTGPAVAASVVAVIDVSELTVNELAAVAPNLTAVALANPEPVMVTDVPPAVEPAFGLTAVTSGTPKVNRSAAEVALVPATLATVTFTVPAGAAEVVAVIEVSELMVNVDAAAAPKLTAVAFVKPVPVMLTTVPPAAAPAVGLIIVTMGAP